jgi:hypothetical protein
MWAQYLEMTVDLTREFWPLVGTVMVVLVIPIMICRAGRQSHLAAENVKNLNARMEEMQAALRKIKSGVPVAEASGAGYDNLASNNEASGGETPDDETSAGLSAEEEQKEKEAEKVFDAFAKACQEKIAAEEAQAEVQEETVAQAREQVSFDGNLAVDKTDFSQPESAPAPQPQAAIKPAPAAAPKPAAKKDRHVVLCDSCGKKLAYKSEWSGKRVKCPSCKGGVALP